jgi:hypothetical protein
MTTYSPPATDRAVTVSIPRPTRTIAPVTGRRIRRVLTGYAVLWVAALALVLTDAGTVWVAGGLGLAVPGGGFLYGGHPVWAAVAVLAFVLSLFTWWAFGIVLAPALVWVLTAAASGAAVDGGHDGARVAALAIVPAALATFAVLHRVRHAAQVRTGAGLNAELARVPLVVTGPPPMAGRAPVAEHTAADLAHLRHLLDLALQPVDRFEGFDNLDQFREAATRYQINALGYALAMSQFTRTPSFTGYLAEAQRNLVAKMLQPKAWNYWALENAWGNLRLDRDPIDTPDNIMITGYWGTQIGMYAALNDDRFSAPGALTFRRTRRDGSEQAFPYAFSDLARITDRNFGDCAFTMFPCEPNWIYSICNMFGINTLLVHDTLYGTRHLTRRQEELREAFEVEFCRPDGKVIGVRNKLLGLSWNLWAGPMVQVNTVYWLHAAFPDLAQRTWWLLRRDDLRVTADGRASLAPLLSSRLDPGNYHLGTDTFAMVATLMAAREVGDEEYAAAAQRALDAKEVVESDGARRYRGSSVWTNSYAALGRFARRSALRDLLAFPTPEEWRQGPVLADAAYPAVLVGRAVSDGRALDLVLRPGAGPVRTTIAVERLVPHRTYAVSGGCADTVRADGAGRALLEVELGGRHELRMA